MGNCHANSIRVGLAALVALAASGGADAKVVTVDFGQLDPGALSGSFSYNTSSVGDVIYNEPYGEVAFFSPGTTLTLQNKSYDIFGIYYGQGKLPGNDDVLNVLGVYSPAASGQNYPGCQRADCMGSYNVPEYDFDISFTGLSTNSRSHFALPEQFASISNATFGVAPIDGSAGGFSEPINASFTVTPMPEPAAWMTMILGIGAVGFMGWRRKRGSAPLFRSVMPA